MMEMRKRKAEAHAKALSSKAPSNKETFIYLLFMAVFLWIVLARGSEQVFFFTESMRDLILREPFEVETATGKAFADIEVLDDIYNFFRGPVLSGLFPLNWTENAAMPADRAGLVMGTFRLLGGVRLRQVRVLPDSCSVPAELSNLISHCYGGPTPQNINRDPFTRNSHTYTYDELDSRDTTIGHLFSYPGDGFVVELGGSADDVLATLNQLEADRFLDELSRALLTDFTIYNGNLNVFFSVRLLLELPPSGGVLPSSIGRVLRLTGPVTAVEWFTTIMEFVFILAVLAYVVQEIREVSREKFAYFASMWKWIDMLNLGLFLTIACVRGYGEYERVKLLNHVSQLNEPFDKFIDFQRVPWLRDLEKQLLAANSLLCWLRLFKYLRRYPHLSMLLQTLSNAAESLLLFTALFLIAFIGYSQASFLLFGSDLMAFRTLATSTFSLFQALLGEFEFNAIRETSRYLGPSFFILFQVIITFILINVFIAILSSSYETVNRRIPRSSFFGSLRSLLRTLRNRKGVRALSAGIAGADEDGDGIWNAAELHKLLQQHSDAANRLCISSVSDLFARYDKNRDRELDETEMKLFRSDLKGVLNAIQEEKKRLDAQFGSVAEDEEDASYQSQAKLLKSQIELIDQVVSDVDQLQSKKDPIACLPRRRRRVEPVAVEEEMQPVSPLPSLPPEPTPVQMHDSPGKSIDEFDCLDTEERLSLMHSELSALRVVVEQLVSRMPLLKPQPEEKVDEEDDV